MIYPVGNAMIVIMPCALLIGKESYESSAPLSYSSVFGHNGIHSIQKRAVDRIEDIKSFHIPAFVYLCEFNLIRSHNTSPQLAVHSAL